MSLAARPQNDQRQRIPSHETARQISDCATRLGHQLGRFLPLASTALTIDVPCLAKNPRNKTDYSDCSTDGICSPRQAKTPQKARQERRI